MLPGPLLTSPSFKHHEIAETLHKIEAEGLGLDMELLGFQSRRRVGGTLIQNRSDIASNSIWCFAPEPI
jgi:hypothetical protein